ncbi:MAG: Rab family GTPase [Promethearchaeota archaeon]
MNEKDIITGIVYIQYDDIHGTTPLVWSPNDLDEKLKILAGIKSISLLTAEQGYTPKSVVIVPFPSYKKKGFIWYLKWKDETRRGGLARSCLTFLFNEEDDVIFYKYREDLEVACEEYSKNLIELELSGSSSEEFKKYILIVADKIKKVLEELKNKELAFKEMISPKKVSLKTDKPEYIFKLIVIGDAEVGKSSLILRFTANAFSRSYLPTLGVNISEKGLDVNNIKVQFALWDIAGQERFFLMRKQFYQGADGVIIVFDLSRLETFNSIYDSFKDIKENVINIDKISGVLIGNKSDLSYREVKAQDAQKLSKELNFGYIETSALNGSNVLDAFDQIAKNLLTMREINI